MSRIYSPNWYWAKLGFTVNRRGLYRTITDNFGNIVCENAGHEKETAIAEWLFN